MYRVACVNKEQSNSTRRAKRSNDRRKDCKGKASSHGGKAGCKGGQKGCAHWEVVAITRPFFAMRLKNWVSVLSLFKNCAQLIVPSHRTQSTVCTYTHIKLLLICLLAPSYYYHQI